MKIIKDEQRLINLHPLVIYFMLPPDEYEEYGDKLKALNDYKDFTHKVFKFQAFSLSGEYGNALPARLTDTLKGYNMMVRLVDDALGNFYYALHNVDFNAKRDTTDSFPFDNDDYGLVESSIQSFIVDVCKHNVEHLNERLAVKSDTYSLSHQNYTKLREVFQNIALQKDYKSGTWKTINNKDSLYKLVLAESRFEELRRHEETEVFRFKNSPFPHSMQFMRAKVSEAIPRNVG